MKRSLTLIVGFLLIFVQQNLAQNTLSIASSEVGNKTDFELIVSLENVDAIAALQFDLNFNKDALSLQTGHSLSDRGADHLLTVSAPTPGIARVVIYSPNNNTISGNSGELVHLKFNALTLPGDFTIGISEIIASSASSSVLSVTGESGTIKILGPQLDIQVSDIDFGRIPLLTSPTRNLSVSNLGNQDLELTGASYIDPFEIQETFPITINANSSKNLTLAINTSAKGLSNLDLSFQNNDPDPLRKIKKVTLKADIFAVNEIKIGSGTGEINTEVEIPVVIENMEAFSGFQFDVVLPEGINYVANSIVSTSRIDGHSIVASIVDGNKLRILGFSGDNKEFIGNSGEVFSFKLKPTISSGTYTLAIQSAILSFPGQGNILSQAYNGSIKIKAPSYHMNPSAISYGNVPVTETRSTSIRISNNGDALLKINELVYDATVLSFDITLPLEITPGNYQDINMTYNPGLVGEFAKSVSFRHNGSAGQNLLNVTATNFSPNFVMINNQEVYRNTSNNIAVLLKNNDDVYGLQFDVALPAGFTLETSSISITERTTDYSLTASLVSGSTYRILLYSPSNSALEQGDQSIISLPINVNENVPYASYALDLSNVIISNIESENIASIVLEQGEINVVSGVGFNEIELSDEILVYPNPTSGLINITIPGVETNMLLKVSNLFGKVILQQKIDMLADRRFMIDISVFPANIYLLSIEGISTNRAFKILKL